MEFDLKFIYNACYSDVIFCILHSRNYVMSTGWRIASRKLVDDESKGTETHYNFLFRLTDFFKHLSWKVGHSLSWTSTEKTFSRSIRFISHRRHPECKISIHIPGLDNFFFSGYG